MCSSDLASLVPRIGLCIRVSLCDFQVGKIVLIRLACSRLIQIIAQFALPRLGLGPPCRLQRKSFCSLRRIAVRQRLNSLPFVQNPPATKRTINCSIAAVKLRSERRISPFGMPVFDNTTANWAGHICGIGNYVPRQVALPLPFNCNTTYLLPTILIRRAVDVGVGENLVIDRQLGLHSSIGHF